MTTYMKWVAPITDEVLQKAAKELGETPESKKRCLLELRELINREENFIPVMEDWFLLIFLRGKKFNVTKAFKTLKKFYEFKSMYSGTITDLRPSQLDRIYKMNAFTISPLRNKNGEAVVIFFLDNFDYENATPYDLIAAGFACAEIGINLEVSQICGTTLVLDFRNLSLGNIMFFAKYSVISFLIRTFQDRWPYRTNYFHVVNQPPYFAILFELIKIFLSKKLKERVILHGDSLESLHAYVPPDILPKRLGGYLSEEIFEEFRSYLYNSESIFDVISSYTYNGISYGQKKENFPHKNLQNKESS